MNENKDEIKNVAVVAVGGGDSPEQVEVVSGKEREVPFKPIKNGKSYIKLLQSNGSYKNFETSNTAGLKFSLGLLPKPTSSGGASKRQTSRRK